MKTNFFITSLIIVFFTLTANSQITKGNWMVGGDINYASLKSTFKDGSDRNSWSVNIRPNVGFFVIDQLSIGAMPILGFNKGTSGFYGLDLFSRYYFLKPLKRVNFFIEPRGGISFSNDNRDESNFSNNYGLKLGQSTFLNQSVALEFFIDYNNFYSIITKTTNQKIFIGFGLQIHLEKDK